MALSTSNQRSGTPVRRSRLRNVLLMGLAFLAMLCIVTASVVKDRKTMLVRQSDLRLYNEGRPAAVELQTARGLNQMTTSRVPTNTIASPISPPPQPPLHTSVPSTTTTTTPSTSAPPSAEPLTAALAILDPIAPMMQSAQSAPFANKAQRTRRASAIPTKPLLGPLCVFIPADGNDEKHLKEVEAVLEAWGDASTLLFTENPIVMERTEEVATRKGIARALVEMEEWKSWQRDLILAHANLRRRGATNESLRGRGQLSIPLFYWISQLVKSNHSLVQNCKWFMKCDTDTYLRRGLLETTVLARYDPELPYHVGVPLRFNTRPFHHTLRDINFQYNIGGPGYTFSRGLMRMVNVDECIESMTRDPVLLIHDDVATGYCATYHARRSMRENVGPCFTSSLHQTVTSLITASQAAPPKAGDVDCLRCFVALHPVRPASMQALAKMDAADGRLATNTSTCPSVGSQCDLSLMLGSKSTVGDAVRLPPPLDGVAKYWHNVQIWQLPVSERMIAGQAKELIDTWKRE